MICSQDEAVMIQDIEHALVWCALNHLPLPRWLHCGVANQLRCVIDSTSARPAREPFDLDLVPEHRTFWNETTIQSFWAGTCETEHPDRSRLFYDLSNILVHFLNERSKSLVDYLRCANHYDAGDSAAQVCLKTSLGELAGTFLGPGHWTPDPLAIVECWDRVRQINSDEE